MASKFKVLQVIPKLGYGGAETGCYDLAHYLPEVGCKSYIITSGGELIKYIDKKKVKVVRLPVQSKNPILIFAFIRLPNDLYIFIQIIKQKILTVFTNPCERKKKHNVTDKNRI